MALNDVAKNLSNAYDGVFDEFSDRLQQAFGDSARNVFRDCLNGDGSGSSNPAECLENAAEDEGVGEAYRRVYIGQSEFRKKLRDAGRSAFSESDKEELRNISAGGNVSNLYTKCMQGEFSEVQSEIDADTTFDNYSDCASAVSTLTGVAEQLKQAYRAT